MFQFASSSADDTLTLPAPAPFTPSGKNARTCQRCQRSFWAWDTGRTHCYLCAPPDPRETHRILAAIYHDLP
jgi:hypothetical protein